jgi:hypothetical protein
MPGEPVLLNPRLDDALRFLALDLRETFRLEPYPGLTGRDRDRAVYTRDTMGLNRDVLIDSRRSSYGSFRARLREYIADRNEGKPADLLQRHIKALQRLGHPTVWREMQRQQSRIAELRTLFTQAPEALGW